MNPLASALLNAPNPSCEENGDAHKPIEIPGYKYQQSGKVQCSNAANLVFDFKFSNIVSCSKKCTNTSDCLFFAFSESDQCVGYQTCTERKESNEMRSIYKKGNTNDLLDRKSRK